MPTHVDSRIAEALPRPSAKRSRIKTIRQQIAIVGHDRHYRREIDVEAQHAQHFTRDSAERARGGKIAVLADRARGRHRCEYAAQAVDEAAFLIDAEERGGR